MRVFLVSILYVLIPVFSSAQYRLDYSGYKLMMEEEFDYGSINEPAMRERWQYQPYHAYWSGGIEMYDESQLSIIQNEEDHKILRIHAQKLDTPQIYGTRLKQFKSGYISYKQVHEPTCSSLAWSNDPWPGFTYGIFEIRCKIPAGDKRSWDAWPAFWLTSFPIAEIDVFDQISDDPGRKLGYGLIDWKRYPDYNIKEWEKTDVVINEGTKRRKKKVVIENFSGEKDYKVNDMVKYNGLYYRAKQNMERATYPGSNTHLYTDISIGYHIYTAVWTPAHLSFFLDSVEVATIKFDHNLDAHDCTMRIIANLAVIGKGDGTPSDFTATDMYFDIDYIRVYQPVAGKETEPDYMWLPPYTLPLYNSEY